MSLPRIGVAGVGRLGSVHARILAEMRTAELSAVFDADADSAHRIADRFTCQAAADLASLCDTSDAIVVAVPTSDHFAVASAALEAGCHVLVEKPLAASTEEADALLGTAGRAGRVLAVGHVERFNPVIRACRELLDDPRFVTCLRLARFQPRGTDVAVTLDLMIHDIDLVLGLVRAPVASVHAVGVPLITNTVDMANARLVFENGAIADVSASRASMHPTRELRVFQESGYLSLDLAAGTGEFLRRRRPPPRRVDPTTATLADFVDRVEIQGDGVEPLRMELEAFVHAIEGRPSEVVTGREGRAALALALEISRQIERGQDAIAKGT